MLKSSLCECSDAYIFVKRDITVVEAGTSDAVRATGRNNKEATFKNCAALCITAINNTQEDNVKDLDEVRSLYNIVII